MGIKPFFHARVGNLLLVSNTLEAIRNLRFVSRAINLYSIGDYLLAGTNENPSTTFFEAIQRLPAAGRLVAGPGSLDTARYWDMPIDEPLYLKRECDYVDGFRALLDGAVRDRLPDGRLAVFMSGGLDSPAITASACRQGASVTAFTSVYRRLIPDEEEKFASMVADHLGIPIEFDVRDDEPWGWEPGERPIFTPAPNDAPSSLLARIRHWDRVRATSRVVWFGDGPDAALTYDWRQQLVYLHKKKRWGRLCLDLYLHAKMFKRIPLLSTLPTIWRQQRSPNPDWYSKRSSVPEWICPDLVDAVGLPSRAEELAREIQSPHPFRPVGYSDFQGGITMFSGGNDGGIVRSRTEEMHPLADLRLLRFLLSVPSIPWSRNKLLVRKGLTGMLPEAVVKRPKSPLAGFPDMVRSRTFPRPDLPECVRLREFVDLARAPDWPGANREQWHVCQRILGLQYWLLAV